MIAATLAAAVLWAAPSAPSPMPVVHQQPCPGTALRDCYIGDGKAWNDVYLHPSTLDDPMALQHELGHAYDVVELVPGERVRIAKAMYWTRWRAEAFADFYAGCRLKLDPRDRDNDVAYGRWVKHPRRVAARCRLIARAGV